MICYGLEPPAHCQGQVSRRRLGKRSNVGAAPRLEGINVVAAAGARDGHVRRAQAQRIDPVRAVIDASQVRLLDAIDPEGQMSIVAPIHFDEMSGIRNVDVRCAHKTPQMLPITHS